MEKMKDILGEEDTLVVLPIDSRQTDRRMESSYDVMTLEYYTLSLHCTLI
jgi:hypothetical protein